MFKKTLKLPEFQDLSAGFEWTREHIEWNVIRSEFTENTAKGLLNWYREKLTEES